jgi:multiple sugar transport system substrate-binding protein
MDEITLSVMSRGENTTAYLQSLLEPFQQRHLVKVKLRILEWGTAWAELVKVALYNYGPDVSEIGTTWVGNLVAMNGLRPYERAEISACGGSPAFLPSAWHSATLIGESEVWAMPWLADTRVMYYRRDVFQQADVDVSTAFRSAQEFDRALQKLQAAGFDRPWSTSTHQSLNNLHNIATWVWGAGGEFVSLDGRRVLFMRDEAVAGMCAYFDLRRYLHSSDHNLNLVEADELFYQGQSALILGGPWIAARVGQLATQIVIDNLEAALPPGVPFVGGSNLVIWRHCHKTSLAAELVKWLTSQSIQTQYAQHSGMFPVKLDALAAGFAHAPMGQVLSEGLKQGRSFPSIARWGLVEDSLSAALAQIWHDLLLDPQAETSAVIKHHIQPVADHIAQILAT